MDTYYNPADMAKFNGDGLGSYASEAWNGFMGYYGPVYADGALTSREKHLIALGVAAALQCPYCIDAHGKSCIQLGCDGDQIMETFHVAASIRAGATLAHGLQILPTIEDNEF